MKTGGTRLFRQTVSTTRPGGYGSDDRGGTVRLSGTAGLVNEPCLLTVEMPDNIDRYGGEVRVTNGTIECAANADIKTDDLATCPDYPGRTFRVGAVTSPQKQGFRLVGHTIARIVAVSATGA